MTEFFEAAAVNIDRGEIDQGINNLIEHLNISFNDETALIMLGAAFIAKGKNGVGAALTRQAIEVMRAKGRNPAQALLNLGTAHKMANDAKAAEEIWRLALDVQGDPGEQAKLWSNIGSCFVNEGDPRKAVEHYNRALRLEPKLGSAEYNRSLALLELGEWQKAWQGYYAGFQTGDRRNRVYPGVPEWDGTPGQTVIVWGEQGVGDEILFASCIPDMVRVCRKVIFDCHPRLEATFRRSFPEVEVHGTRKTLHGIDWVDKAEADASVCISTLPKFFRNRDEDFPGTPFLRAAPGDWSAQNARQSRIPDASIGISWAGGTKKTRSDLRSIPLPMWEGVLRSVDADFYSLQYTNSAAREVCELEEATGIKVKHYPGWVECKDYDRTASFVASMDLVITVGTAVHHLANALGVPTWTLCPSKPSWRYTEKALIWYASTNRQFRQAEGETWEPVLARVAEALHAHL